MAGPIASISLSNNGTTSSLALSWSVNWNGSHTSENVSVTVTRNINGQQVYSSISSSGSVTVSSLNSGEPYTATITASSYYPINGYTYSDTKSSGATTSSSAPPSTYTVTWNPNGGSVSPTSSTVSIGSSVSAPTPTWSGYSFSGWYTAPSGGSFVVSGGGTYTPSSNITLYAVWGNLPTASVTITSVTSNTVSISWSNSANGGTVDGTGVIIPTGVTWTGTGTPDAGGVILGYYSGSGTISGLSASSSYTVEAFISTIGWIGYPDNTRTFTNIKTAYTAVPAPSFSDSTLSSDIYKDLPYSDAVAASPVTSYSWSGYPAGLILNTSTGAISGTPTTEATYTVTITATNAGSGNYPSSSTSFSTTLTVKPATPKVYTNSGWQRALAVWTYTGTQNGWQRAQVKARANDQWNPPL